MLLYVIIALIVLAIVLGGIAAFTRMRRNAILQAKGPDWVPGDEDDEETLALRFRNWIKSQPRLKFNTDELGYNPRTCGSVQHFRPVVLGTNCLFAKNSKLCGSKDWDPSLSLEDNVRASLSGLAAFLQVALSQHYDGFVFEVCGKEYGDTVENFGETVRRVLLTISDSDPNQANCMRKSYIDKRGWCFEFLRETMFVTTFGPCFPSTHSRYAFGCTSSFILFQPEYSFAWHNIESDTPHTNWENPTSIRDKIRVEFRKHGRDYEIPDTIYYPPALHIVRPLRPTDPPVEWWRPREGGNAEERATVITVRLLSLRLTHFTHSTGWSADGTSEVVLDSSWLSSPE